MDFFARQDVARKKSGRLVFYFIAAVALIIITVYVLVAGLGLYFSGPDFVFWDGGLFFVVSLAVSLVVSLGSLYKLGVIRKGGGAVAPMMWSQPATLAVRMDMWALAIIGNLPPGT